ncbi:unnamed protein product [Agarophyton chilense]|eukprot:gb/GEZJ01003540.1/.p1 GENE.gb/GEZJ01003540.1/~~gb/GEZJ01003540.1/.p1  ORF type:complete len:544 (-),score=58.26 gb/GEZJ01003540.1/:4767-6398(-)
MASRVVRFAGAKPSRTSLLARLREKGRVYAPESDMHPTLPHRDLLLKTLGREQHWKQLMKKQKQNFPKPHRHGRSTISEMVREARMAAQTGDLCTLESITRHASMIRDGNPTTCLRAVTVRAVLAVADDKEKTEAVMNALSPTINTLSNTDVGTVLDILVRGKLRQGDVEGALYGEKLSRVLEVGLRRGTYTQLIERTSVEKGIALLHRAICVGVEPNLRMFNVLLRSCCESGDGIHARAVMHEMGNRGLVANCDTMEALLIGAREIESVDAVSSIIQNGGVRLNGRVGGLLVRSYLRCVDADENRSTAVQRAVSVVDWFHKENVLVDRAALEFLTSYCARTNDFEAALRGWRELRRSWMGVGRARRALWIAARGHPLRQRLLQGAKPREMDRMYRADLGAIDPEKEEGRQLSDVEPLAQGNHKDIAAVLGRWMISGRSEGTLQWLKRAIASERGIHISWAVALLRGCERKWADSFIELLEGGYLCGKREVVLDRATSALWNWICWHKDWLPDADIFNLTEEQVRVRLNQVLRMRGDVKFQRA